MLRRHSKHYDLFETWLPWAIFVVIAIAAIAGCAGGNRYTIDAGSHTSGISFVPHFGDQTMCADVQFTESCRYTLPGKEWQDWNKLFGLSYGAHQDWSMRWGWRCNPSGQLEVAAYLHLAGEIVAPEMHWRSLDKASGIWVMRAGPLPVEPGKTYRMFAMASSGFVTYTLWDIETDRIWTARYYDNRCRGLTGWGYLLKPWFGGTFEAPHTVILYVRTVTDFAWATGLPPEAWE